jgi:tetratricopeptide (TPR) repeat protein
MNKKLSLIPTPEQNSEPAKVDDDHLDSWKEIANYLRREVRTVQLWEKKEALPVHRHFHKRLGSVFARRSEIEVWKQQVSQRRGPVPAGFSSSKSLLHQSRITIHVQAPENQVQDSQLSAFIAWLTSTTARTLGVLSQGTLSVTDGVGEQPLRPSADSQPDAVDYALYFTILPGAGLSFESSLRLLSSPVVLWSRRNVIESLHDAGAGAAIAECIAQCVWLKVSSSSPFVAEANPARRISQKRGPREAYLKGRYFWNQRNEEGLRKAIRCFEEAIHEDPNFALPYSGLADALTLLSFYEIVSPAEAMPSARNAALRSIELNPNLAEAHASFGDVLLHFDRDWQAADREYRLAIQCNPEYALGYHWYSNLLAGRGEHDAAEVAIMQAVELDPVSIICLVWAGFTAHMAHRFDDAIKHYRSALELDPRFVWAHMYLGLALEQKGEFSEALKEFQTAFVLAGGSDCIKAMKAHAHAMAGEKQAARRILLELRNAPRKCVPSYDIAATYAALDEPGPMVAWLNRACHERSMKLFALPQDPRFDSFRNRPEFLQVVAEVGITPHSATRGV